MRLGGILKFGLIIGLLLILVLSLASSAQSETSDNYGINAFRNQLDNANFVVGSEVDKNTVNVVFKNLGAYSTSDYRPNVFVGGPEAYSPGDLVRKMIEETNEEFGINFEVLDSDKTGIHPTEIILSSRDPRVPNMDSKEYKVTSNDFGKESYFVVLRNGETAIVEGADWYGTKAGAMALIGEDLPYDKVLGIWKDLDSDGEVDEDEIEILESSKIISKSTITIDGKINDWDGINAASVSDPIGDSTASDKVGTDIETLYAACNDEYLAFAIKLDGALNTSKFRNYFIAVELDYMDYAEYHFGFRPNGDAWLFDHTVDTNDWNEKPAIIEIETSVIDGIIEGRIPRNNYYIPNNFAVFARVTEGGPTRDKTSWVQVRCKQ